MRATTDDSPALRHALIAGARRVIAARDGLNRINVFPVADCDTGNNLAFTLGSVLNGALSRRSCHVADLLAHVGNDAIADGADPRGRHPGPRQRAVRTRTCAGSIRPARGREAGPGTRWRVIVGHCDAPAEGERLLAALRARLETSKSFLVETGAAVGSHAGPGALIVAVQPSPAQ